MEFVSSFVSSFANLNWEVIAQLTMIGLIIVAGPLIILLMAARGSDL
ncbi:MAG TPA: photosystem II reaction center protein Ycf12 [Candidatus Caenarcaniphilales bacterium]